jgi:hypothetical protein
MSRRQNPSAPKVFISHSHQNRHSAVELQKVLEENNAETFLDQDRIEAADNLPARVREGISWCESLLLLWSASAAESSWVQQEWELAYDERKKIIPYVLDPTPLPFVLENLVYIEADDQKHGNAHLLKAVFGKEVRPKDPRTLFPGRWHASVDAFGIAQGTYDLELRANGQVEGHGGVSNTGLMGQLAAGQGVGGILNMRIPIHGSWSYERGAQLLTIETSTAVIAGRQQNDTIMVRATGYEKGAISGQDLAGRIWTLRRVEQRAGPQSRKEEREKIRQGFQHLYESAGNSPVLANTLAIYCLACKEKCEYDHGLPSRKARRVMQTNGAEFQTAVQEFFQALERGGWIS